MSAVGAKCGVKVRRAVMLDTDTESEGNSAQEAARELTQEEKDRNAALMSMADLGSARRGEITAVGKGHAQAVNIAKLLQTRDCELLGTKARKLAAENKGQLQSWANFGNTDVARKDVIEELDNIGNGQSHRQLMAERLLSEGVRTLEDTYDDHPRHKSVSALHSRPCGKTSGPAGGLGPGALVLAKSSTKGYRPLDPAVVTGEKDSKYGRDGLQAAAKAKFKGKGNNHKAQLDESTVKIAQISTAGRGFQKRPWPPKALEHLVPAPPLADPTFFMAAATKTLSTPKTVAKATTVQALGAGLGQAGVQAPTMPSITIGGLDVCAIAGDDQHVIKQASRLEFRGPDISPDQLTEGKLSPQVFSSPGLGSECTDKASTSVGLGIIGEQTEPVLWQTTTEAKQPRLDIARIRCWLEKKQINSLVEYLEQALVINKPGERKIMQESAEAPQNPFNYDRTSRMAKSDCKGDSMITTSGKTASSYKASSGDAIVSKPLTESVWATAGSSRQPTSVRGAPLQPNPTKKNVSEALKARTGPATMMTCGNTNQGMKPTTVGGANESMTTEAESLAIFGDVRALCGVPSTAPGATAGKGGGETKTEGVGGGGNQGSGNTRIKRTSAGPGYEALVREIAQVKEQEMQAAKKEPAVGDKKGAKGAATIPSSPVTRALRFANSLSKRLELGGSDHGSDGNSTDWEF